MIDSIRREIHLEGTFSPTEIPSMSKEEVDAHRDAARQALQECFVESMGLSQRATLDLTAQKVLRFLVGTRQVSILSSVGSHYDERRLGEVVTHAYGWRFTFVSHVGLLLILAFLVTAFVASKQVWWQIVVQAIALYITTLWIYGKWLRYFARRRCLDTLGMTDLCWETNCIAIFDRTQNQTYSYHLCNTKWPLVVLAILDPGRKESLAILSSDMGERKPWHHLVPLARTVVWLILFLIGVLGVGSLFMNWGWSAYASVSAAAFLVGAMLELGKWAIVGWLGWRRL